MKFTGKWLQFLTLVLILVTVTVGLLQVARAKTYIARNTVVYEKVWHANGSVTLYLIENGYDFAYHTNHEAHEHTNPIYRITLKNVLCSFAQCLTCSSTE